MPKIIAVPVTTAAEAKFALPEPDVTFETDGDDIVVTARFKDVDSEVFKKSKQTLYFSRTVAPVSVEVEVPDGAGNNILSVLAIDSQGRQPLQFRCGLSAPFIEEKEQTNGENAADNSGDPEDEEV